MWNNSLYALCFSSHFKNKNEKQTHIFRDKIFPRPETANSLMPVHLCLVCEAVPYLRVKSGKMDVRRANSLECNVIGTCYREWAKIHCVPIVQEIKPPHF